MRRVSPHFVFPFLKVRYPVPPLFPLVWSPLPFITWCALWFLCPMFSVPVCPPLPRSTSVWSLAHQGAVSPGLFPRNCTGMAALGSRRPSPPCPSNFFFSFAFSVFLLRPPFSPHVVSSSASHVTLHPPPLPIILTPSFSLSRINKIFDTSPPLRLSPRSKYPSSINTPPHGKGPNQLVFKRPRVCSAKTLRRRVPPPLPHQSLVTLLYPSPPPLPGLTFKRLHPFFLMSHFEAQARHLFSSLLPSQSRFSTVPPFSFFLRRRLYQFGPPPLSYPPINLPFPFFFSLTVRLVCPFFGWKTFFSFGT